MHVDLWLPVVDGSSSTIRTNAAEKLGELATHSPVYCRAIVRQLRTLLTHSEWDVRVAACGALDMLGKFVAKSVPELPQHIAHADGHQSTDEKDHTRLSFENVAMETVLTQAAPLLRCGGEVQ